MTPAQKPVLIVHPDALEAATATLVAYRVQPHPQHKRDAELQEFAAGLAGQQVDIWPNADDVGRDSAAVLASYLLPHCSRVRVVNGADTAPAEGWNVAKAVAEGWDAARIRDWGRAHIKTIEIPAERPAEVPRETSRRAPVKPPAGAAPTSSGEPAYVLWERLQLARNDRGPFATEANALRIIAAHESYAGRIWLDEFSQRLMIDDPSVDPPYRLFSRTDAIAVLVWMQEALQLPKMPLSAVERAAVLVGERNKRHPLKTYLTGLKWDGVERLPDLMANAFGTERSDYTAAVGRCFFVAMVARVMQPGCKHDLVPVFEGQQGARKSSALSIIGGQWFLESTEDPVRNRKDFLLGLQGKLLVEIPEIDRVGGSRGSLNDLTALITIRTDSYRVPYGATTMDYPRQSVMAGTANRTEWNPDQTGGRRFLPITCGDIDTDYLTECRDHLFAEAMARYASGESWWDVPVTEAAEQQENRRIRDEWETVIERFTKEYPDRRDWQAGIIWFPRDKPLEKLTMTDILFDALGLPEGRWDRPSQMRVAACLIALGWRRARVTTDKGREWVYVRHPKTSGTG